MANEEDLNSWAIQTNISKRSQIRHKFLLNVSELDWAWSVVHGK